MNFSLLKWLLLGIFYPSYSFAGTSPTHGDPLAAVIFWGTAILIFALLGRYLAKRLNQPAVLGELLMGVLVGNLCYFYQFDLAIILREASAISSIMSKILEGKALVPAVDSTILQPSYAAEVLNVLQSYQGFDLIKVAYALDIFARYGVIFLLFKVGLESSIEELKHTGKEALRVACIGVIAPMVLGFLVTFYFLPSASYQTDLFIAATLSATSIGITARVLRDLGKLKTREAKTILGAATIDDVLGLIILAIVSSIVISGKIDFMEVGRIILLAIVFFLSVLTLGRWLLAKLVDFFQFMEAWEAKLFAAFIFVMSLAWFATLMNLAALIGAFAAGLIVHDDFFTAKNKKAETSLSIKNLIAPFEAILAPVFFMLIGIQVKLETFLDTQVLMMALLLITAAIIGKLLSGLGASKKDDRLLIGIGMLPRGEVGLVFASIGKTLNVVSDQLFTAIVLMVIVSTAIAPSFLKARYARGEKS